MGEVDILTFCIVAGGNFIWKTYFDSTLKKIDYSGQYMIFLKIIVKSSNVHFKVSKLAKIQTFTKRIHMKLYYIDSGNWEDEALRDKVGTYLSLQN